MFVLDTNVLSELRRPEKANAKVVAWASATPVSLIFLTAITMLEIELGALQMERRDRAHAKVLRDWIETQVMRRFGNRILALDTAAARQCARLHADATRSQRDAMIAATAMVHGMKVVTRNVSDFAPCGVEVINPWD